MSFSAFINPEMLRWAIKRKHRRFNRVDFLLEVGTSWSEFGEWLDGTSHPSLAQVQAIADILDIPFGYFWLSEPPHLGIRAWLKNWVKP